MRLLLVEDDQMIGQALLAPFDKAGIAVDWVRTGADAAAALRSCEYAVTVLDIGLPDMSGLDVLENARRLKQEVPILLLTARDQVEDRVKGLDLGADDYLAKPFAVSELLARVRALTRRKFGASDCMIVAGGLALDLAKQELTYGEQTRMLPGREFALMRAFMERPGIILSRSQIEDHLYGWNAEVESNAVDVLIHAVRRKFGKEIIRNIRGAGWMIVKGGG